VKKSQKRSHSCTRFCHQ